MKRLTVVVALMIGLAPECVGAADEVLTFTGIGTVRVGMTVTEAEAALDTKLKPFDPKDGVSKTVCWLTERADNRAPWITFMVQNGKIVRIDVWKDEGGTPPIRTDAGVKIGDDEQTILSKYGAALKPSYHPELDIAGHYATVLADDGKHGLQFETADGVLVNMRAGVLEAIELRETCL